MGYFAFEEIAYGEEILLYRRIGALGTPGCRLGSMLAGRGNKSGQCDQSDTGILHPIKLIQGNKTT